MKEEKKNLIILLLSLSIATMKPLQQPGQPIRTPSKGMRMYQIIPNFTMGNSEIFVFMMGLYIGYSPFSAELEARRS